MSRKPPPRPARPARPVYWKPRYPTRSMRERAWAKGALPARSAPLARLLAFFRRRRRGGGGA